MKQNKSNNLIRLGNYCIKVGSGITPRGGDKVYIDSGTALIRSQNIYNGLFTNDGLVFINDDIADKMKGIEVVSDDVLLNITGDSVARCCLVPYSVLPARVNQHVSIVRVKRNDINSKFLMYYFVSPYMQATMLSKAGSGGTRKALTKAMIEDFDIPLPSLNIQDGVAEFLSKYDELISNNLRRIELLEESTRLLYREWFVHLRFPGHEHTKISKGVPDGWERKSLKELCEIVDYGYTASAQEENVGPKFLRITDIVPNVIDWSTVPYCELPENRKEKYRLREGDIVVARTGATVGYAKRINKRNPESVFASYLVRFRFKPEIDNLAIGVFMESDDYKNYVKSHVGGAAQPNANAQILSGARVLIPDEKIKNLFKSIIEPIYDQKEILQNTNETLKKARDILLPRLMNGDIAV